MVYLLDFWWVLWYNIKMRSWLFVASTLVVLATAIILASGPAGKPGFISLAGAIGLLLWAEKRGSPK
jgi:hypothetical protein